MDKNIAVLEIGGRQGDSAIAWSNYLGGKDVSINVITHGGNNDKYKFNNPTINYRENNKVHTFYLDQSKPDKLKEVIEQRPNGWNIVVDDRSHVLIHNVISFETLWKNVRPGSICVVEDIETSHYNDSWVYGYKFQARILVPPPFNSLSRFHNT